MKTPSDQVTVQQLDELIQKIHEKELEIEKQTEVVTNLGKELAVLEGNAVGYLKDLGRETYDSPFGKLKIEQKWRVNMPADDQAKAELFAHFRERGIFDKYATVHSVSLNSLYKADWEAAKERGEGLEFTMPGIGAPTLFEKLRFKPAKKGAE